MTDLHRYEESLDKDCRNMTVTHDRIIANFEREYHIPFAWCNSESKALNEALAFSANIHAYEPYLHPDDLAKHLIQIAARKNKFKVDACTLYQDFKIAFAGEYNFDSIQETNNKHHTITIKSSKNRHLKFTIKPRNLYRSPILHIQWKSEVGNEVYQSIDIKSVAITKLNKCIFLCLPKKSIWQYSEHKNTPKPFFQHNVTRLALNFDNVEEANLSFNLLNKFLKNVRKETIPWANNLLRHSVEN